jgi:hypothetical protein
VGSGGGGYGSVKTATLVIPSFLHEAMTRHAISPRFAINTLVILGMPQLSVGSGGIFNSWPVFCEDMFLQMSSLIREGVAPFLLDRLRGPCLNQFYPAKFKRDQPQVRNLSVFSLSLQPFKFCYGSDTSDRF